MTPTRHPTRLFRDCIVALVVGASLMAGSAEAAIDPPTPDEQALQGWLERFEAAQQTSADLRIRLAFIPIDIVRRTDGTTPFVPRIVPAVSQAQARGSTDPIALTLLAHQCGFDATTATGCDRVDVLRRWVSVDTGNAVAWLMLSAALRSRGDVDASRDAFVRAGRAPEWREHVADLAQSIRKLIPVDATASQRHAALLTAAAKSNAVVPYDALSALNAYCAEPGAMRVTCLRIVDLMARDAETLMSMVVLAPAAAHAQASPQVVASLRRRSDAIFWAAGEIARSIDDDGSPASLERSNAALQSWIEYGERGSAERYLRTMHVADDVAAARFVATLSPDAVKLRETMLRKARAAAGLNAGSARSTAASP